MLDNAIEACLKLTSNNEKFVKVKIGHRADYLIIVVENPSLEAVDTKTLNTTKDDGENHGLGVRSINEIAEKSHGNAFFEVNNGVFMATATTYKMKPNTLL